MQPGVAPDSGVEDWLGTGGESDLRDGAGVLADSETEGGIGAGLGDEADRAFGGEAAIKLDLQAVVPPERQAAHGHGDAGPDRRQDVLGCRCGQGAPSTGTQSQHESGLS